MMNNTINKYSNRFIYPIDAAISYFVASLIAFLEKFCPQSLSKQVGILEKYRQVLENIFGLTGLNALGGFLMLLTQVKLANTLGASTYGVFSYCLAIGEVGAMVVRYGRNKTMTRDLIQQPERRNFLIVNTFLLGVINLAIFMLIVALFHTSLDIEVSIVYMLLIVSPCLISLDFQPVYESMRMMSWHSIYNLMQKILFLVLVWLTICFWGCPSLLLLGITLFTSWITVLSIEFWEIKNTITGSLRKAVHWGNILILYKENFTIALSCLFGVAFGPLLRLILKNYTDDASVGIYAAGMQIFLISQFILNQIGRVGNPMMAEAGRNDCPVSRRRSFIKKYLVTMIGSTIPFALPMLFIPHIITRLLFTEEYAVLGNYLPLFAFYLITLAIGIVFTQFLISMRKDKIYFSIYMTGAMATVVTAHAMIPHLGVLGAVIALCIPHGIACIGYAIASIRYL